MIGYYKNTLIKMFQLLNDIKAAPNESLHKCFDLQILIIKSIFRVEKNIRKHKIEIDNLKKELKSFKDEESRKHNILIGVTIKRKKEIILKYKDIIHIFRCVGDGIAYLLIDKYDIKPMVFKQDCGFLSGKKGFRAEMKFFRQAFQDEKTVILNDITNCLRYGDITVPVDGIPFMFEVKTKKIFSKRNCRQEEALKALSEYLLTDKTDNLYGRGEMKRESIGFPEVNYTDKLNELIEIAYNRGNCTQEIENGLFYSVATNTEDDDFIKVILEKVKKPYVAFINQAKYETIGYYPFTLSIEKPERLLGFYCGDMLITVFIDMDVMTSELLKHGLKLSIEEDTEEEEFPFLISNSASIDLKDFHMRLSRHFFGRIAFEFLSLKWFINEIAYKANKLKEEHESLNKKCDD